MRILSQDGKYDFPYEKVCLEVSDSGKIFAQGDIWGAEDNYIEVAKYENEAKARKAMDILHEVYTGIPLILQNVDISEEAEEMFKKWKKQGIFVVSENQPSKVEYVGNILFQFPADDEVEV